MKNIIVIGLVIMLASCSSNEVTKPQEVVLVKTVPIKEPKPIIPEIPPIVMRTVKFDVLTEKNISQKFEKEKVYYGLSIQDYKNLSLNLGDMRAYIEKQKVVLNNLK